MPWDLTLLRYNADGSPDPSFGSSGVVKTRLGPGSQINAPAASVALQPDGNILAASENDRRFVLARYGADGALDPTFGSNGIVTTELQASGFPSGLALQTDGQIVIAGNDGIARYRPNGTPDAAFGINGVARTNILIDAVVLQQDGRIVTGGTLHNNFALSRYAGESPTTIGAAPPVVAYGRTAIVRGTLARKESGVVVEVTQRVATASGRASWQPRRRPWVARGTLVSAPGVGPM